MLLHQLFIYCFFRGATTHIIVVDEARISSSKTLQQANKYFKRENMPAVVTLNWFIDCLIQGKAVEEASYAPPNMPTLQQQQN